MPSTRRCVFGCNTTGVTIHNFPNPRIFQEQFRIWVGLAGASVSGLTDMQIYNNRKVCDKHFAKEDKNRNSRLNALAVPHLHIPMPLLPVASEANLNMQSDFQNTSVQIAGATTPAIQKEFYVCDDPVPTTSKESFASPYHKCHDRGSGRTAYFNMNKFDPTEHQHIRYNPLKDEWILVSPHRCQRPWSGQTEELPEEEPPNPNNPLRAGAVRSNGQRNPNYESTYVFPNDFPALLERVPEPPSPDHPLFQAAQAKGTCRVMCFHPDSTMTIPLMSIDEILAVINEWINQLQELGRRYTWVQIFENKGAIMGCSNPHPHCQIWASSFLPNEPRIKDRCQKEYYTKYGKPLLVDYLHQEMEKKTRIILQNSEWVALVPYWATWPYESMLLPINGKPQRMTDLNEEQKKALAMIMKQLTTKYDNLFRCSFPYSMGWHGAPTGPTQKPGDSPHWLFHGVYLPPLLRSATVKKFMVGYEMLAQSQRDLTPEQAAMKLRECGDVHYKNILEKSTK